MAKKKNSPGAGYGVYPFANQQQVADYQALSPAYKSKWQTWHGQNPQGTYAQWKQLTVTPAVGTSAYAGYSPPAPPKPPPAPSANSKPMPTLGGGPGSPLDPTYWASKAKLDYDNATKVAQLNLDKTLNTNTYEQAVQNLLFGHNINLRGVRQSAAARGLGGSGVAEREVGETQTRYNAQREGIETKYQYDQNVIDAAIKAIIEGGPLSDQLLQAEAGDRYAQRQTSAAATAPAQGSPGNVPAGKHVAPGYGVTPMNDSDYPIWQSLSPKEKSAWSAYHGKYPNRTFQGWLQRGKPSK